MSTEQVRAYEPGDLAAVQRIWREVGWTSDEREDALIEGYFATGDALVYVLDGEVEAVVQAVPGTIRHDQVDLSLSAITAVTTSSRARRRGAARRLTAQLLTQGAAAGAQVASLGMFDQGFYDALGFGTGPYDIRLTFDPGTLAVDRPIPTPVRLTADDAIEMHACMVARRRGHGGVTLDTPATMRAELSWLEPGLGLGFRDAAGRLTHFVYGKMKDVHGMLDVRWVAYESIPQLLDLLALLRSLADQIHTVRMIEPSDLQLQDLLRTPFREARKSRGGAGHEAVGWWQLRVLDLGACVAAVHALGEPVRCNVELDDPAAAHLPDDAAWRGLSGSYVLTLADSSTVRAGSDPALPTMTTGVGGLSRLLLGVRPASSLAAAGQFDAPPDLLAGLDRAVRLPTPHAGWDF